jgi:hypothetical protein
MARTAALAAAALLSLALPAGARALGFASLTVDVWGGVKRYDALKLTDATADATRDDLLDGSYNAVGATAVLKLGLLELGALYEGGLDYDRTKSMSLAGLAGPGLDAGPLRVELLGEVGAQRYSDIGGTDEETWLPYAGVRPGLSLRFSVAPALRLVVGAWGFWRRDLDRETVGSVLPEAPGPSYRVGGTSYGVVGRVGFEI